MRAGQLGQSCQLTQPTALYPQYTAALAAKGRSTCKVSNARYVGGLGSGGYVIETACSDGLPGYVIVMTPSGSVSDLLTCGQAKSAGVTCALPGNTK